MKRKPLAVFVFIFLLVSAFCVPVFAADTTKTEDSSKTPVPTPTTPTVTPTQDSSTNSLSPNVIISSYSFGGDNITNGKKFTLNYTLKNTSANITIRNILVKVAGSDSMVITKDTDTFYVDSIGPKATKALSIALTPKLDASTTSYPVAIGVSFEYFDGGSKYTGTAELTVTIPLVQTQKLRLEDVGISDTEVYTGTDYEFGYSILNTGYGKINNLEAAVYDGEGNMLASSYLGNVAAAAELSSAGNLYVNFDSAGTKSLEFVLTYEDGNGVAQTVKETSSVDVLEFAAPSADSEEMPVETGSNPGIALWIILGVLIIAASVGSIVISRKKKAKKAQREQLEADLAEEEEEDEDF